MQRADRETIETFAAGIADGMTIVAAGVRAGYSAKSKFMHRRAKTQAFLDRVAEIHRRRAWGDSRELGPVIDRMMLYAEASADLGGAAGMVAARQLLSEAAQLKQRLPRKPEPGEINLAEWAAKRKAERAQAAQAGKMVQTEQGAPPRPGGSHAPETDRPRLP